ncbi:MAG: hypothetical protein QF619_12220 [Candidatus Binatia bacterium]|jgi:hypothetical protein|nr:hypothetical protein [Candidatus Binatia bacterium]|tara:strand:- start:636 stop:845 length:210 start_codon:yes stop_codon:yes gene_type:complete
MEKRACLSRGDEEKLVGAYMTLQEFTEHEFPVVRLNCRKARSGLRRALFELGLMGEAEVRGISGIFADG